MSSDEDMVERDTILACIACSICKTPYKKATTINKCLHTFCRKCIYKKLQVEGMKACPECNVDLGVAPLSKLRPSNEAMKLCLLPHDQKRKNNNVQVKVAGEANHSASVPTKKEVKSRSLASLMISSLRVATNVEGRGQCSKPIARRKGRGTRFNQNKPTKKDESTDECETDSSTSTEQINIYNPGNRRNSTVEGPSVEYSLEIRSANNLQTPKAKTGASQYSVSDPTGPSVDPIDCSFKTSNLHDTLKLSSSVATGLHVKPTLDKGKQKMPQTSSTQQADVAKPLHCKDKVKKAFAIEIVNISDSDDSTPPKSISLKKVRRLCRKSKHFCDIRMPSPP